MAFAVTSDNDTRQRKRMHHIISVQLTVFQCVLCSAGPWDSVVNFVPMRTSPKCERHMISGQP